MTYARIIGTGSYVPAKVLTNADLGRMAARNLFNLLIDAEHLRQENERLQSEVEYFAAVLLGYCDRPNRPCLSVEDVIGILQGLRR